MGRPRSTDNDKTAKRRIDVAAAFAEAEAKPGPGALSRAFETVPVLMLPRGEVPWGELGELATNLLLRVDGRTSTRDIATASGTIAAPEECAREMAALAQRGILELKSPPAAGPDDGAA